MAGSLTNAAETAVLEALFNTSDVYPAPFKCALVTVIGSDSSTGTEATGGSYARQTISFAAACTVVGVDIYDSNGSPIRVAWASLAANKTVGAGDTLVIPTGSLTVTLD